jgi:hypothetical protein
MYREESDVSWSVTAAKDSSDDDVDFCVIAHYRRKDLIIAEPTFGVVSLPFAELKFYGACSAR